MEPALDPSVLVPAGRAAFLCATAFFPDFRVSGLQSVTFFPGFGLRLKYRFQSVELSGEFLFSRLKRCSPLLCSIKLCFLLLQCLFPLRDFLLQLCSAVNPPICLTELCLQPA